MGLNILSLGFTRDLWEDPVSSQSDTLYRLEAYSKYTAKYYVITHSLKRHKLKNSRAITKNFYAYATDGYTVVDSWLRMLFLGLGIGRKQGIDLIQTQDPLFTGSIGYVLSRLLKKPYNICIYGPNPFDNNWVNESWLNKFASGIARQILSSADGIQVDGRSTKHSLVKSGIGEDIIAVKPMIPFNIDTFLTSKPDSELRTFLSDNNRYTWLTLYVGRLVPQKNLDLLLRVAAKVVIKYPDVRFVCIGDGPERRALEKKTNWLGLKDVVLWLGGKPHKEIPKYMATCDVILLTSWYEGFARVLIEGAASGKPIISTAVSGSDEGVKDEATGYITPIGDTDSFLNAFFYLVANREFAIKMGIEGRRYIKSLIEHYSNPYLQVKIWERIVGRRKDAVINV